MKKTIIPLKLFPYIPIIGIYLSFRASEKGFDVGLGNPLINISSAIIQAISITSPLIYSAIKMLT